MRRGLAKKLLRQFAGAREARKMVTAASNALC